MQPKESSQRVFVVQKNVPDLRSVSATDNAPIMMRKQRTRKFSQKITFYNDSNNFGAWKIPRNVDQFSVNAALKTLYSLATIDVFYTGIVNHDITYGNTIQIRDISQSVMDNFHKYCEYVLWPMFHSKSWGYDSIGEVANADYWRDYEAVNRSFCDNLCQHLSDGSIVWILDYELMLLPKMIIEKISNVTVGISFSVPFPSSEHFRCIPQRKQLLQGILSSHMVSFLAPCHSRHFSSACTRILGVDSSIDHIQHKSNITKIAFNDMGIDVDHVNTIISSPDVESKILQIKEIFLGKFVLISVDSTKHILNVYHKLVSLELFLKNNPDYKNKVVFVQICSQDGMSDGKTESKVTDLTSRINSVYGSLESVIVYYYDQNVDMDEYIALMCIADCFVSCSEKEGFNPSILEYLACQKNKQSPLIISETSCMAYNFGGAIMINPWNHSQIANAIKLSLEMSTEKKKKTYEFNSRLLTYSNCYNWAYSTIKQLIHIKENVVIENEFIKLSMSSIFPHYIAGKRRLLILDYDGTVVPIQKTPQAAVPSEKTIQTLISLSMDPHNIIYIVSGRDCESLENWLGSIEKLGLSAEHGSYIRHPGSHTWQETVLIVDDLEWKNSVIEIFEYFCERTPGSFIEKKQKSIVWHYRMADSDFGSRQAKECQLNLESSILSKFPVEILLGKKNIEVRSSSCNKGTTVKELLAQLQGIDFIFCAGDDRTDEDMFRSLESLNSLENSNCKIITCLIGSPSRSLAKYYCENPDNLLAVLSRISRRSVSKVTPATYAKSSFSY